MNDWEPKITAFLCAWCSYAAADLAGINRIQYPPNRHLCMALMESGFQGDTLENVITWRVIIMPDGNSHF